MINPFKYFTALFLSFLFQVTTSTAADRYVSLNGTNDFANKFITWAGAATDIQWAVNFATNGETVWVSNGTYYLTNQINIANGILLKSFSGSYTNTVINGNYPNITSRCVSITFSNAAVDGFTITNGYAPTNNQHGGGAYISAGTLKNCLITGNTVTNNGVGGGAYVTGVNGFISNCYIFGNTAYNYGGGTGIGAGGTVFYCQLMFNRVLSGTLYTGGGGAYMGGAGLLQNSSIISNTSGRDAGGVYMNMNSSVRNCLITTNIALRGGGIFSFMNGGTQSNKIESCTIVNNGFAGVAATYRGGQYIYNSIIYSNTSLNVYTDDSVTSYCYSCCTITGAAGYKVVFANSENITNPPAFSDFAGGNYRLTSESPCVNAGLNLPWMESLTDLDGFSRIDKFSDRADMGCYEHHPRGLMFKMR